MNEFTIHAIQLLARAFTPTQPIALPDLLSGRGELVERLVRDIFTPSQHVLLYGDRGVGKTSIARVLGIVAQQPDIPNGMRSLFVSCDSSDNYGSIWRKVFQEILVLERQMGFERSTEGSIVGRWDTGDSLNTPNDVRLLLQTLPNPTTIVIDEFDRIESGGEACRLMTDTVKLFSDVVMPCSIVLVGVGQSIADLISAHESISRNIDYVEVEPLRTIQLARIIRQGLKKAEMTFESGLDVIIAQMSQGYPHYTHLLGQHAAERAAARGSHEVMLSDLEAAIPSSIQRAAGGIQIEYDMATDSTQPNNLFREVLLACALAEKDNRGRFPLRALQEPLGGVMCRPVNHRSYQRHLALFCDDSHGRVLTRTGRSKNYRWSFSNPQLVPYILLRAIKDKMLPDDVSPLAQYGSRIRVAT